MSDSTEKTRRTPLQSRSQETVQRIRDATAALLARGIPVETLTTAHIATEAALSVGALYRFFPDKQSIVDAIALRHMDLFQEALAFRLMLAPPPDPPTFLAAVIDAFAEYVTANPDFRTIAFGAKGGTRTISPATQDAYATDGKILADVRTALADLYEIEITPLRLRLAIEIGDRLLAHAFACPEPTRTEIITETKRILVATLL